jgi:hypothetical protein
MIAQEKQQRPPVFGVVRVIIPGLMIYILFSTLFGFFFVFSTEIERELGQTKSIVIDLSEKRELPLHMSVDSKGSLVPSLRARAAERLGIGLVEVGAVCLGLLAAWIYHRPLVRYFGSRRRGEDCAETIIAAARARVWRSPPAMALAAAIPIFAELVMRLILVGTSHAENLMFPIELAVLALSTLFTYLWQRHRIQSRVVPFHAPT